MKYRRTFIKWAIVAVLVGFVYILLLDCGVLCWAFGWAVKECIEDEDPIRTALGFAGAVLVITNTYFVITRIRRTDTQIEKQEEQIEESKNNNFLATLHQGINMLYADNINMQMGGVEHLHSLAEIADKEKKSERIERLLEIFCAFVKDAGRVSDEIIKDEIKKYEMKGISISSEEQRRNREVQQIKSRILRTIKHENDIYDPPLFGSIYRSGAKEINLLADKHMLSYGIANYAMLIYLKLA